MRFKRGQISTEYLIVVGFVTLLVIGVLVIALYYSASIRDQIKFKQIASFANNLITTAEEVYYAGEPSKTVITPYIPEGVNSIEILGDSVFFNVSTSAGISTIAYPSNVLLEGTLSASHGVKRIQLIAQPDKVLVIEGG